MKKTTYYLYIIIFWSPVVVLGQDSTSITKSQAPTPVEIFAGHRALSYQHVLSKDIGRFNFFNVAAFDAEYGTSPKNDFVISSFFSYQLGKGFSLGIGGEIQPPGANFIVGAQYVYASNQWLLVLFPSVTLQQASQFAQLSLLEFRPKISQGIRGYFRAQVLVSTNFITYDRGYQQFRLGLQINQVQFGLAANYDQFASNTRTTTNYGAFVRLLIF
ncbi:hypothetical protein BKI52_37145 [marine bacterium AO1-C]|nr:hypothetical protein BKI52_37145 [marine bacterium AO1-C]